MVIVLTVLHQEKLVLVSQAPDLHVHLVTLLQLALTTVEHSRLNNVQMERLPARQVTVSQAQRQAVQMVLLIVLILKTVEPSHSVQTAVSRTLPENVSTAQHHIVNLVTLIRPKRASAEPNPSLSVQMVLLLVKPAECVYLVHLPHVHQATRLPRIRMIAELSQRRRNVQTVLKHMDKTVLHRHLVLQAFLMTALTGTVEVK
jgi:hypothetical protein